MTVIPQIGSMAIGCALFLTVSRMPRAAHDSGLGNSSFRLSAIVECAKGILCRGDLRISKSPFSRRVSSSSRRIFTQISRRAPPRFCESSTVVPLPFAACSMLRCNLTGRERVRADRTCMRKFDNMGPIEQLIRSWLSDRVARRCKARLLGNSARNGRLISFSPSTSQHG